MLLSIYHIKYVDTVKSREKDNIKWVVRRYDYITSYTRARRMVRKPNGHMCGRDCKPVLRHPRTVRIPFVANQNLLVFCANTKRTGCAWCPFYAPGVLCSPQVPRKLINYAPLMRHMQTVQHISGTLVYTRFIPSQSLQGYVKLGPDERISSTVRLKHAICKRCVRTFFGANIQHEKNEPVWHAPFTH